MLAWLIPDKRLLRIRAHLSAGRGLRSQRPTVFAKHCSAVASSHLSALFEMAAVKIAGGDRKACARIPLSFPHKAEVLLLLERQIFEPVMHATAVSIAHLTRAYRLRAEAASWQVASKAFCCGLPGSM